MTPRSKTFSHVVLFATLCTAGLALGDHDDDDEEERRPTVGKRALPVATQPQWAKECSSCHMLYPPALLPERSWRAMMGGLDKHFGENATLDAPTRDVITEFLAQNSADRVANTRAGRIAQSIPASSTPLRITETRYFVRKHDEVSPSVFARPSIGSKANCVACHQGAASGVFSEHQVRIPR